MIADLFLKKSFFHVEKNFNLNLDLEKLEKDYFLKKKEEKKKITSNITNTFISYILQTPIKNIQLPMYYLSKETIDKINVIDYIVDTITNITNNVTNKVTDTIIERRYNL
jgi:hypothetical protein